MPRLRIVTLDYAPDLLETILCPERFEILGEGQGLAPLSQSAPEVLVLGFADFQHGLALTEQILLRCPRLVILMVGPSQEIGDILQAMKLGVRHVIPEGAAGEIRSALEWAWTLHQGLFSPALS